MKVERIESIGHGYIIGWNGDAGAGKNVCGEYMADKLKIPTYAFASPLKDSVNEMFGWGEEHKEGDLKEVVTANKTSFQKIERVLSERFGWIIPKDEIRSYVEKWVAIITLKLEELDMQVLSLQNHDIMETEIAMEISPRQAYQWFGTEWGRELVHKDLWLLFAERELVANDMFMVVTDCRFDNEAEWIGSLKGNIIKVEKEVKKEISKHASENGINPRYIDYCIDNNVLDDNCKTLYASVDAVMKDLKLVPK